MLKALGFLSCLLVALIHARVFIPGKNCGISKPIKFVTKMAAELNGLGCLMIEDEESYYNRKYALLYLFLLLLFGNLVLSQQSHVPVTLQSNSYCNFVVNMIISYPTQIQLHSFAILELLAVDLKLNNLRYVTDIYSCLEHHV